MSMQLRIIQPLAIALAAGTCALIAPAVLAQGYAGQDGRALERDLRVGAGNAGLTPRASMADEVRLRNALITGNVGGLRSFHGSVGYTAPNDFRGSLGSDSTYSFRRDSTSSSQFSRPLRGGEGLRYQFYTSTGLSDRRLDDEVGRLGATGTAAAKAAPGTASQSANGASDSLTQRVGAIRSTAAYGASRDLTPAVVGYSQSLGQYAPVTASSLLGLRNAERAPLTTRYAVVDKGDKKDRPGLQQDLTKPLEPLSSAPMVENQIKPIVEPVTRTLYQDLRDRIKKQEDEASKRKTPLTPDDKAPANSQPGTPATQQPDTGQAGSETPVKPDESDSDRRLRELRERLLPRDKNNAPQGSAEQKTKKPLSGFDEETVDLIRRAGGQTGAFIDAPEGATLDLYSQHMKAGQDLLSRNKFFDAEERFARALDQKPGDVTAMAARMHSQLGAGLYLSAAINIRQLFVQAPEVIAMRYSGPTIPPPQRLSSIAADLRANITRSKDAGTTPSVGDSLLLAYVGWQLSDLATVDDALSQAQKSADASGKPEPLVGLLRKTWLETPSTATTAPQQPQGAPTK